MVKHSTEINLSCAKPRAPSNFSLKVTRRNLSRLLHPSILSLASSPAAATRTSSVHS